MGEKGVNPFVWRRRRPGGSGGSDHSCGTVCASAAWFVVLHTTGRKLSGLRKGIISGKWCEVKVLHVKQAVPRKPYRKHYAGSTYIQVDDNGPIMADEF